MHTSGLDPQGNLQNNYLLSDFHLFPLGHWNWKWNSTRTKYPTYEQEILAGVLTISSQFRVIAGKKLTWFCDNIAVCSFPDSSPSTNPRIWRWFVFLSQLSLRITHILGLENEFFDYISRYLLDEKLHFKSEELAEQDFVKMDTKLDLSIFQSSSSPFIINASDYIDDLSDIYSRLEPFMPNLIDNKLYFKIGSDYTLKDVCVFPPKIIPTLRLVHSKTGHPGSKFTVLSFFQDCHSQISKSELISMARDIVRICEICALTKTNSP